MAERLLTAAECAQYLRISYGTLRNFLAIKPENVPPFIMIGTVRRWRESDIQEWITKRMEATQNKTN